MTTEPEKIYPPWTDEEVDQIRDWQNWAAEPGSEEEPLMCSLNTHFAPPTNPLVATILGMSCPEEGCGGLQEWTYAYMLEGAPGS